MQFEIIGESRFRSKLATDDVIRNFKIAVFLAIGFAGIPIVVERCLFKWLNNQRSNESIFTVVLCQVFRIKNSEKMRKRAILETWKSYSVSQDSLKNFKISIRYSSESNFNWKLMFVYCFQKGLKINTLWSMETHFWIFPNVTTLQTLGGNE